jgi:hypothetical protein
MVLACTMLGVSGGARFWQEWRTEQQIEHHESPPFPLQDLSRLLGHWRYLEGSESSIDPRIARIAGSSDHLIRTYVDDRTGVGVSTVILYGRAETVSAHSPEVCYPSAGYVPAGEPSLVNIEAPRGTAVFRSLVFVRGEGAAEDRVEVLYTFLHDGRWSPVTEGRWKEFRKRPSMIKVQIQRRVTAGERREQNNPSHQFLAELTQEIERRENLERVGPPSAPPPTRPARVAS